MRKAFLTVLLTTTCFSRSGGLWLRTTAMRKRPLPSSDCRRHASTSGRSTDAVGDSLTPSHASTIDKATTTTNNNNITTEWFLYLIRCGADRSLYTGITTNVQRRFQEHQRPIKRGAKYLRGRGPLSLVFQAPAGEDRSTASQIEHAVKALSKARKEALVAGTLELSSVWPHPTKADKETSKETDTTPNQPIHNHVAPLYITIGPPCSGKTEALRNHLWSVGYNPDDVFDRDVAHVDQGGVYRRIPLVTFLFPHRRLDATTTAVLYGTTTIGDRLRDPAFVATDQELRHVLWRLAGRITPREFATRRQAAEVVRARTSPRRALAHDLARAVEQVVVQAVGEVICQMQLESGGGDDDDDDDSIKGEPAASSEFSQSTESDTEELPEDRRKKAQQQNVLGLEELNALSDELTSARKLSERKLIGTTHIDLFVPQALFQKGIPRSQAQLLATLETAAPYQPVSWGNTNTRPNEYAAALTAAQHSGRPVEFIAWGSSRFPRVSRQELLRRNVARLRRTGRYIPAGAMEASLGRVETLMEMAHIELNNLFGTEEDNADHADTAQWKLNAALASLAGFRMDQNGFVTQIDTPKPLPNPYARRKVS